MCKFDRVVHAVAVEDILLALPDGTDGFDILRQLGHQNTRSSMAPAPCWTSSGWAALTLYSQRHHIKGVRPSMERYWRQR